MAKIFLLVLGEFPTKLVLNLTVGLQTGYCHSRNIGQSPRRNRQKGFGMVDVS